jgi:hypothetical protein
VSEPWTPGPWLSLGEEAHVAVFDDVSGGYIAECAVSRRIPKEQQQANARLIAAAPEMAKHLAWMVKEWHARVEAIESGRAMDNADAVIERNARHSERLLSRIRREAEVPA